MLLVCGLALMLAVPAWAVAGPGGALWALAAVGAAVVFAGRIPARVVLVRHGAGPLQRHHAPELYRIADELYRRAGIENRPQLFYVPSPVLNAFAVGNRRDGGIALTDGLLRTLDLRQIAGILAHEVSHLRHNDTRVMSMAAAMTELTAWGAALVQALLLLMLPVLLERIGIAAWLILFTAAVTPTLSTLLQLALSRNREYTADLEAVALLGEARSLASALVALERYGGRWLESFFGGAPRGLLRWLQTHPPTWERIRRLQQLGGRSPDQGEPPVPIAIPRNRPSLSGRPARARRRLFLLP